MGFMDQFRPQAPTPFSKQMVGNRLEAIRSASNGNPSALIAYLDRTDPVFSGFLRSVQGKTPQQAFQEHGLDFSRFSELL